MVTMVSNFKKEFRKVAFITFMATGITAGAVLARKPVLAEPANRPGVRMQSVDQKEVLKLRKKLGELKTVEQKLQEAEQKLQEAEQKLQKQLNSVMTPEIQKLGIERAKEAEEESRRSVELILLKCLGAGMGMVIAGAAAAEAIRKCFRVRDEADGMITIVAGNIALFGGIVGAKLMGSSIEAVAAGKETIGTIGANLGLAAAMIIGVSFVFFGSICYNPSFTKIKEILTTVKKKLLTTVRKKQ